MKGGSVRQSKHTNRGFTIVETMIVLAVSMFMFLGAVALINGRQNTTAFSQSIRAIQTQLQQVINEVGSGYYLNDGTILCSDVAGKPVLTGGGTDSQGSSAGCLFLGKVLQFSVAGTDPEEYNVYTLVGVKSGVSGSTVSLVNSGARVIAKATGEAGSNIPDIYDVKKLQYGLEVSRMYYNGVPGNTIGSIGFVTNLTSLGEGDGSQRTDVVAIPGTALNADKATGAKAINDRIATGIVNPASGVQICFNSGGTNQSGLITIGGSDRQGTVDVKIYAAKDCV